MVDTVDRLAVNIILVVDLGLLAVGVGYVVATGGRGIYFLALLASSSGCRACPSFLGSQWMSWWA